MGHNILGLDTLKLVELAKGYNIDLYRWMFAVKAFEKGIISLHNTKDK